MSENLFEIRNRMCKEIKCHECPMQEMFARGGNVICSTEVYKQPQKAEEILLKWAEKNPLPKPKTMADRFYEIFPEAPKRENGTPYLCVVYLGWKGKKCYLDRDCSECWNKPYK